MRATDPLVLYVFVVGFVLPIVAVVYLELRDARRRRREAERARRRRLVEQRNVRTVRPEAMSA